MKNKKATNKQILDAYGQSYRLMQEAKRHNDKLLLIKKNDTKRKGFKGWSDAEIQEFYKEM